MPKCFMCGKEVYPAEKAQHDGKIFHNICFQTWRKQQQIEYKHTKQAEYYKKADVVPSYYRVADVDTGKQARMTAGVDDEEERKRIIEEENKFLDKVANQSVSPRSTSKICQCGASCNVSFKFCPSCGAPLS